MHLFSLCNLVDIIWEYGKFPYTIFKIIIPSSDSQISYKPN